MCRGKHIDLCGSWRAIHILSDGRASWVEAIHLTLKSFELSQSNVAGAALGRCRFVQRAVGLEGRWRKSLGAFLCQRRFQNIGRAMKVILCMATDQLLVLGKSYITFDDARAHARSGFVGLLSVFGELQPSAPVTDRENGFFKRLFAALLQSRLERPRVHIVDKKIWPGPNLDIPDILFFAISR